MKQGSYRVRWENLTTGNIEEARIDVERRDIFVSSDLKGEDSHYVIHFDIDWQLDDFEVRINDQIVFQCQRKMNGMWVDRSSKRIMEEFKDFQYFHLTNTPMTHMMATRTLSLQPGVPNTIDVALFDVVTGKSLPVKHTYTKIDQSTLLFSDESGDRRIMLNQEEVIVEIEGRFKMIDFQIW